jgi:hypothetical protein
MKVFAVVALLASSTAAYAASPEEDYLSARDRVMAAIKRTENGKDASAGDALFSKATRDLEQKLKAVVGPLAAAGFPAEGKLNFDTLSSQDEGFGALDGIVYSDSEGGNSVVVTTDGLLDKWLVGHRHWWKKGNVPPTADAAVKAEAFYTQAVSTDAAIVHYADMPIAAPPGSKFAYAMLSARTQDLSPNAPDEIFIALEHGGRVFIASQKLKVAMNPIAACDAVTADYAKKSEAADKAYADSSRKNPKLADVSADLRTQGDAAFRACYGDKAKDAPEFKAAADQAAAVVAALAH